MARIEQLLCRVGIHKWEKWDSVQTPLVPILNIEDMSMDGRVFDSDNLAIETRIRTCKRCGKGQVANILHW